MRLKPCPGDEAGNLLLLGEADGISHVKNILFYLFPGAILSTETVAVALTSVGIRREVKGRE